MTILALDTSSKAASCAILRDDSLVGEFFIHTALTHSQTMMPMVQALLKSVGMTLADIDVYAVSTGPGSFTGLRIGIASVKGMALASDKPCAAVSTLEGLARNLSVFEGYIVPAMDARRAQVYTARFRCEKGVLVRETQDAALSLEQMEAELATLAGPVLLVGDGAAMAGRAMEALSHVAVAPAALLHQRAGSVAVAAAEIAARGGLCSADALEPAYLRLPQAERERLARLRGE